MDELHICAECTDFIGGGDWGLCCKSAESYNFLCYAFTTACERFKPGRKIKPRIFYTTPDGEGMVRQFNGDVCWGRWVELAKQTIAEGNRDVRIVDFNHEKYPTLLWHEKRNKEVDE